MSRALPSISVLLRAARACPSSRATHGCLAMPQIERSSSRQEVVPVCQKRCVKCGDIEPWIDLDCLQAFDVLQLLDDVKMARAGEALIP